MATINMHIKFEIEIPKQSGLTLRKPCVVYRRTDGQRTWIQYTPPPPPPHTHTHTHTSPPPPPTPTPLPPTPRPQPPHPHPPPPTPIIVTIRLTPHPPTPTHPHHSYNKIDKSDHFYKLTYLALPIGEWALKCIRGHPVQPQSLQVSVRVEQGQLIIQCNRLISHNAPLCNRNVHMCAHFCYKLVHCGIWDLCIV